MDALSLLRTFGALAAVLGLLSLVLWATRRYNIRLPGTTLAHGQRRLAVVERIALDARRSVALIRRDGREHLILISPEGHQLVESGIEAPHPAALPGVTTEGSDFASILAATTAANDRATMMRDALAALNAIRAFLAPALARIRDIARRALQGAAPHWRRVHAAVRPIPRAVPTAPAARGKSAAKLRTARGGNAKIRAAKRASKQAQHRG